MATVGSAISHRPWHCGARGSEELRLGAARRGGARLQNQPPPPEGREREEWRHAGREGETASGRVGSEHRRLKESDIPVD
jgi:hypothetical protein